jgi:hypothetical protein
VCVCVCVCVCGVHAWLASTRSWNTLSAHTSPSGGGPHSGAAHRPVMECTERRCNSNHPGRPLGFPFLRGRLPVFEVSLPDPPRSPPYPQLCASPKPLLLPLSLRLRLPVMTVSRLPHAAEEACRGQDLRGKERSADTQLGKSRWQGASEEEFVACIRTYPQSSILPLSQILINLPHSHQVVDDQLTGRLSTD